MADRYYRKVIRIRAEDSPNVMAALLERRYGVEPSGTVVIPGVLPWHDYEKRRATWDAIRQCIGLDADFYEGAEVLLFPPLWLNRAESPEAVQRCLDHPAEAIGIDPAEGGDRTAMAAVNRYGLKDLVSKKTPDTNVIVGEALAFVHSHGVPPSKVYFDRGGGGKEHADRLRAAGHPVKTVAFGEPLTLDLKRGLRMLEERVDNREEQYTYRNRRAQMYGELRQLLDPSRGGEFFALPPQYAELRRQLSPIPLTFDEEGRLELLPKDRRQVMEMDSLFGGPSRRVTRPTLKDLIGHSPDEADALVLAVYAMQNKAARPVAGAVGVR